jgi:hypothetical protein
VSYLLIYKDFHNFFHIFIEFIEILYGLILHTNNLNMSEQSYPQNLPYMQSNSSNRPSRIEEPENTRKSKLEISNSEILMSRIQDL